MLQYVAGHPRDPDTADESYAFVKYSIAKTGFRRQERVTRAFDEHGRMVPPSTIPRLFEPLREVTRYLLPSLRVETVDLRNENDQVVRYFAFIGVLV
jgi:hypothetical protein